MLVYQNNIQPTKQHKGLDLISLEKEPLILRGLDYFGLKKEPPTPKYYYSISILASTKDQPLSPKYWVSYNNKAIGREQVYLAYGC